MATNKIQHVAVHQLPTTAQGISTLVISSIKLIEALQDPIHTAQLEDLHNDILNKIKSMELQKNALECNLVQELKDIQLQREELEKREKQFVVKMLSSDNEISSLLNIDSHVLLSAVWCNSIWRAE